MVVVPRPKPIAQLIDPAPWVKVGKHRVDELIEDLRIAQLVRVSGQHRTEITAQSLGRKLPCASAGRDTGDTRSVGLAAIPIQHPVHFSLRRRVTNIWTGYASYSDRATKVVELVILRCDDINDVDLLRVRGEQVKMIHECLLGNLPVAPKELYNVPTYIPLTQPAALQVGRQGT